MGAAHLEALRRVPGVEVAAVASNSLRNAEALAEPYDIPRAVDDWEALVGDETIDVVHNCTPNHLHYKINKDFTEAGVHVLSEKPLTTSLDDAIDLVELAHSYGTGNAVNFNYRFYPLIQQARSMVANGELGEVHLVHGHYLQDWLLYDTDYNWRLDPDAGGPSRAVADIGAHWCDLAQFVTGRRITRVFADLFTVHASRKKPETETQTFQTPGKGSYSEVSIDTEDGAMLLFEFANGARGSLTVSQVSAGRKNHQWFEIDGARQSLAWNQERPNELWIGRRDEPNQTLIKDPALLDEEAREYAHYPGGHPEGYPDGPKNLFRNFYRHLREDRREWRHAPDYPNFIDGLRQMSLVEAALKSNASGEWTPVPSSCNINNII